MKICNRPRVIIANDHTLVAEAFRNLLEPELDVVAVEPDGRAVLRAVEVLSPVLKQDCAAELLVAMRKVLRGESYLSPLINRDTVEFLLRSGARHQEKKKISSRQRQVLKLLAAGKPMKDIANILKLSFGTIAYHKYRLMEILEVKTSAALVEYASNIT